MQKNWKLGDTNGKVCNFLRLKTSIFNLTDLLEFLDLKQMQKTSIFLLFLFFLFIHGFAFSQNKSNTPLFNCVDLAQQIQNRAATTNLPFNGNSEDYANSLIEKIVVAAYVDYITNLFSTAKRDVSQQERESIANQAV